MRVAGIDPGTKSFDFCVLDGEEVILDRTLPSEQVNEEPSLLVELLDEVAPLELVVGHSGLGIELIGSRDVTDFEISQMLFAPHSELRGEMDGGTPELIEAMYKLYKELQNAETDCKIVYVPAVIHLPTVPDHRKVNKTDMGTSDKLCCALLGVKEQADRLEVTYEETSFILVEAGFGFTAALAVEGGKVVDGSGGTVGSPGFLAPGAIDAELARIIPHLIPRQQLTRKTFTTGGALSVCGEKITPRDLPDYELAWNNLLEGIKKEVAKMAVSIDPREIIISGRLTQVLPIRTALEEELGGFAPVKVLTGLKGGSKVKHAAQGGALLANGLAGGAYKKLVETMKIRQAAGTLLDHVYVMDLKSRAKELLNKLSKQ